MRVPAVRNLLVRGGYIAREPGAHEKILEGVDKLGGEAVKIALDEGFPKGKE